MGRPGGPGPLDPIFDVDTKYGAIATGNTPGVVLLTVTINQQSGQEDPTSTEPVMYDVVFSEDVIGFETGDVDLDASTCGGVLTGTVTGSGSVYEVAVEGMTTNGDVIATIPTDVATATSSGIGNLPSTSTDNVVTWINPLLTFTYTEDDPQEFWVPDGITELILDQTNNGGGITFPAVTEQTVFSSFTTNPGGTVVIGLGVPTATWTYESATTIRPWKAPDQIVTPRITAQGGTGAAGGGGGEMVVDFTPTPTLHFDVYSAKQGDYAGSGTAGWPNGGLGGPTPAGSNPGHGGGGSSSVRPIGESMSDSLVVAAGGGGRGASGASGVGYGGYPDGGSDNGGGATQTLPGAGGGNGEAGDTDGLGEGGDGGSGGGNAFARGGGGGGGGWHGGGGGTATDGGNGGPGGGGSSYYDSGSTDLVSFDNGVVTGNGSVVIVIS